MMYPELNTAYPEYRWYPEVFVNVSNSAEAITREYMRHRQTNPGDDMTAYVKRLVQKRLGVVDASANEISLLVKSPETAAYTLADIISRRAQSGWSTHGHSGNHVQSILSILTNLIQLLMSISTPARKSLPQH
jgi:alkaline phosphatase